MSSAQTVHEPTITTVTFPAGDPVEGKVVFSDHFCTACHRVSDDPDFGNRGGLMDGPDLALSSGKSIGYLATAIIAPSHQVGSESPATEPDPNHDKTHPQAYVDSEGNSLMPSVNESLTVAELVDLLAYLSSAAELP